MAIGQIQPVLDRAGAPEAVAPIPWQRPRKGGRIGAYWRTVFHVMRRFGRLGGHMGGTVSYRDSQTFRWLTILHAVLGQFVVVLAAMLFRKGGLFQGTWPRERFFWQALGVAGGVAIVSGLVWVCMTGIVSWFFCPKRYDVERRNRSIALSYYTCAPLALPFLLAIALLAIAPFGAELPALIRRGAPIALVAQQGAIPLWYVIVLVAGRSVANRSAEGVALTGLALPVCWSLAGVVLGLLPAGIAVLALAAVTAA